MGPREFASQIEAASLSESFVRAILKVVVARCGFSLWPSRQEGACCPLSGDTVAPLCLPVERINRMGPVTQVDEVRALTTPFCRSIPMPILPAEPDCHPPNLLDLEDVTDLPWWLLYTKSRQEKQLMRHLRKLDLMHYAPQIAHRRRSPAGRVRTTYAPLFNNYVFLCGDDEARYEAVCTGCVQKATAINDTDEFVSDLRQIRDLINLGVPLTLESRLEPGQRVRVRSGAFMGYEGTILRREQETRLLVSVHFMEQGVSVKLEDCQLEPIG